MFDVYFCQRVVCRLRSAPSAGVLAGFLGYLHHRGHARNTVHQYLRAAELFLRWLRHRRRSVFWIDEAAVRRFACRRGSHRNPSRNVHAALRHLVCYLRSEGRVSRRPTGTRPAVERIIDKYDAHLRDVCGLAPATRLYRRRYAREFVQFVFGSRRITWRRIRPQRVQAFISKYGRGGRVAAAQVGAVSLRNFLRWLQFQGRIGSEVVGAVPHFAQWRLAPLPTVMSDDQLASFLASFDLSRPTGSRDYAMAVCMTTLGLRASEVADLKINDVDKTARTLRLSSGKLRRARVLPLPRRVHQAVFGYVRRHRTQANDPHLFLRHRTPVGAAVTHQLIRGVMQRAFAKVRGCEGLTGTHVLRHTAATRLHRAGADLKGVADILGHRSIDTTAIYTKVDLGTLAQVALPWPDGKEVRS